MDVCRDRLGSYERNTMAKGKHRKPSGTSGNMWRRVAAGTIGVAGVSAAAMSGAGTASALGWSYDDSNIDPVTIGWGATSDVKGTNNAGLAVSIFGTASVKAGEGTSGNTLLAIDGNSSVTGSASNNVIVSVAGGSTLGGNSHNNLIVNGGGSVSNQGGNAVGQVSLSACGTSFTGQAAKVVVSHGVC